MPEADEKKPLLRLEDDESDGVEGALLFEGTFAWKSDVLRDPDERDEADRLFSATTLSDFSNTFHSLIVLSLFEYACMEMCMRCIHFW